MTSNPSRSRFIRPPRPVAAKSALAFSLPPSPSPWSANVVSAAAMPEGNLRFSTLIICRLSGMAKHTPRNATEMSHAAVSKKPSWRCVITISAGTALTSPAPAMAAAAEAEVCMVLFSSTVKCSPPVSRPQPLKTTQAVMAAVMEAP